MRAKRKDANHHSVLDHIVSLGWSALDLASFGAPVDLAVGKPGIAALVEIKDGAKPPSKRKITKEGQALRERWEGPYLVVTSPADAEQQLARLESDRHYHRDILEIASHIGRSVLPHVEMALCLGCGVTNRIRWIPEYPSGSRQPQNIRCESCGSENLKREKA
jgi:hypothetical protein